jgi:hypothetical protein
MERRSQAHNPEMWRLILGAGSVLNPWVKVVKMKALKSDTCGTPYLHKLNTGKFLGIIVQCPYNLTDFC